MPTETLQESIRLWHELGVGDSPSPATSTSHAGLWPLCQRRWQSRTVPGPCLWELPTLSAPSHLFLPLLVLCLAAGPSPPVPARGNNLNPPTGLNSSVV